MCRGPLAPVFQNHVDECRKHGKGCVSNEDNHFVVLAYTRDQGHWQAVTLLKGVVGAAQTYTLRNETACTVKVLVNEDHEDLKSVAKAKGGLHLEFTFAGDNPVGVGGQAADAGQHEPVDLTIQPNCQTSVIASTSTVFVSAAFWTEGAFKIVWENRNFGASSTIHFLQKHLDDKSEQWIPASSFEEAPRFKQVLLPSIPAAIPQEACRFDQDASPGYAESPKKDPHPTPVPKGFLDVTRLAAWSQTCKAFIPARVLGVAPTPVIDATGQPLAAGSVYLEVEYPDGSKHVKVVSPAAFATHLQEQPPCT
eukprot:s300_g2.t2